MDQSHIVHADAVSKMISLAREKVSAPKDGEEALKIFMKTNNRLNWYYSGQEFCD